MFQNNQILGVCIAIGFICACLAVVFYLTRKLIAEDKILFLLLFVVTLMASVWAIDNVIAFNMKLLDDEENKIVLQMLLQVVSLTLGYWMRGDKTKKSTE
ncbi:MAG: hypothetical protein V4538_15340 [Bacteroidota bacterium]